MTMHHILLLDERIEWTFLKVRENLKYILKGLHIGSSLKSLDEIYASWSFSPWQFLSYDDIINYFKKTDMVCNMVFCWFAKLDD